MTNAPTDLLSPVDARVLLRVRWQIELPFKRWKSLGAVDESPSANVWRRLCEVYAKLLAGLIKHWVLLVGVWHDPWRGAYKATNVIMTRVSLLSTTVTGRVALIAGIAKIVQAMQSACQVDKRRGSPATTQRLLACADLTS